MRVLIGGRVLVTDRLQYWKTTNRDLRPSLLAWQQAIHDRLEGRGNYRKLVRHTPDMMWVPL